jgi:anti-sigma factor RsiW
MSPLSPHVEAQVLEFHFAELPDAERAVVEAHLRECPACVSAFLEVKRHVELAEGTPRPSPAARARLRAAVAAAVLPPRARWERPVAFALAAAAALLAASMVGSLAHVEPPVRRALVR